MNPLPVRMASGTVGEILVQLRFLEHGVQAAAPLKDSGNDLIALRGRVVKAVQVKAGLAQSFSLSRLPEYYDLVALVHIVRQDGRLRLDESRIFLLPEELTQNRRRIYLRDIPEWELSPDVINRCFPE